ncbi:MAG: tRNA preQ1(34) S-adenosylmethionine ribosyltransferase-isomerase QueA [Anaerolineae bacterium]|nr:tRNA preQ1(34) S-adenosylmethionine ribosyltransferase-isomerase QueA [Anaerolineae bacterium]
MNLSDFDYDLPQSFIAQEPLEPRDSSKLMRMDRHTGAIAHSIFRDIVDFINPGDVLVMNTTRVIPARLFATKANSGGKIEILLLRQLDDTRWHVLAGGRRILPDLELHFAGTDVTATVLEELDASERIINFSRPVNAMLTQLGEMPLPPYIHHRLQDSERYQTVYSRQEGSAAAPTAGLHFTPELLLKLRDNGVKIANCVLHVGLDTFQPVKVDTIEDHHMHSERAYLSADDARIINEAKLAGGRIISVGTTSTRTLETSAILSAGGDPAHPEAIGDICAWRPVMAFDSDTNLFIYPGYQWRVVDAIITNFHLPKSTLLMMMSSFAGRENILHAYETAKQNHYRFFSFGDAMFIS